MHQPKKMPEQTQRKILETAISLIADTGVNGVSLQAVAQQAGVTKGGLLHHFPNKTQLIKACIEYALNKIDEVIDDLIQEDPVAYGCLTRAYLYITLNKTLDVAPCWNAFSMAMLTDKTFSNLWKVWFEARLQQHKATDSAVELQVIRYAADGLWLTQFIDGQDQHDLKAHLIQKTYPMG